MSADLAPDGFQKIEGTLANMRTVKNSRPLPQNIAIRSSDLLRQSIHNPPLTIFRPDFRETSTHPSKPHTQKKRCLPQVRPSLMVL
jgi:hypothetical protein